MALMGECSDGRTWIFLHIPKTGGSWFREAIKLATGKPYSHVGQQHSHFPELANHINPDTIKSAYYFAFVRHPITWYQSRWAFRVKHGWHMSHPIDRNCSSNDFREWVDNLLIHKPGWVSTLYKVYIERVPSGEINVGTMENLVTDATNILQNAGVEFDEQKFIDAGRINDSSMGEMSSKQLAKYTPELLQRVLDAEKYAIDLYYPDTEIDFDEFCGEQPY